MGTKTVVRGGRSGLEQWTGVVGPAAVWATNLEIQYAAAKWSCEAGRPRFLMLFTTCSLLIIALAAEVSWALLKRTPPDAPTDGAQPDQRTRFMAVLGLTSCAFFALAILAMAIPVWVLDACH